jgi:hypothetical protein
MGSLAWHKDLPEMGNSEIKLYVYALVLAHEVMIVVIALGQDLVQIQSHGSILVAIERKRQVIRHCATLVVAPERQTAVSLWRF